MAEGSTLPDMGSSAKFKEGDRVRVVSREITAQDKADRAFYGHMVGLTGVVANVYGPDEIAVQIDIEALPAVAKGVHKEATKRMRAKFVDSIGEDQRKMLSKEELAFTPHYVLLLRGSDLEAE